MSSEFIGNYLVIDFLESAGSTYEKGSIWLDGLDPT